MRFPSTTINVFLVLVGVAASGCGAQFDGYCTKKMQCEGGNDADIDACAATLAAGRSYAEAYDCAVPYGKYTDCLDNRATCESRAYGAKCDDEAKALASCEEAASATKSGGGLGWIGGNHGACEEYARRCSACAGNSEQLRQACQQVAQAAPEDACQAALDTGALDNCSGFPGGGGTGGAK